MTQRKTETRREFLQTAGVVAGALFAGAPFVRGSDKAGTKTPIVGEGEYKFACHHGWGELPESIQWGDTHGVTIDKDDFIYIKHRNSGPQVMDAVVVFDPNGKYVRSFGSEYHGGGHGIDIRTEDGTEYLYLSDVKNRQVIKCDTSGEWLWKIRYPREAGVYQNVNGFRPTNIAFAPDGGFYVGDGYGSHFIHQYDADAKWVRTWGGAGKEPGKMQTPHGLWLDDRPGREPTLCVCDRANARLQYFSLEGEFLSFVEEVSFPADIDIQGEIMLVPDLHARVTLFDKENRVLAHLGYEESWTQAVLADNLALRQDPGKYRPGRFVHPHDACFDRHGNIFVVEWVPQGRVTFLERV